MKMNDVVYIKLGEIRPYEKNTKKHPKEQIEDVAESIKSFGFKQPLVLDKNNVIIIGHCRYEASKLLGLDEIPCIIADDLNDEQVRKLRIADNKTNESDWDLDMLTAELEDLKFDEFNFKFDEIKEKGKQAEEDNYDLDEADKKVAHRAKYGDVYILGNHRLMCGDSTKLEDVQKLVGDGKIDLLLTDPPYNVNYTANDTRDGIANDAFATNEQYVDFLSNAFKNADSVMELGASFYIFFAGKFTDEVIQSAKNADWDPAHLLIWRKDSLVLGRSDYQYIHEPFLYGWKEGAKHKWFNDRKQTSVVDFARPKASKLHPTMKPIPLFSYLASNNTAEGDAILDLFGGSGTTLIVCEQINRKCYMMEFDPHYVDVIVDRYEQLTGLKAIKEESINA